VKGLGEDAGRRIEAARRAGRYGGVEDLMSRAHLDKREIEALAVSGALAGFGLGRREAMWKVRAPRERSLFAGMALGDEMPELPPISRAEQLVLDYEATGVSVGDHAMQILRPSLPARYKSSRELTSMDHGASVSTAGMVICRQRPGTASGVVFITLEDETGFINLILWAKTFERWRHVATTSSMLVAHGKVERDKNVVYVVPDRLERLQMLRVPAMSRDFH
jgi:error-prone DNA polymerase